MSCEDLPFNVKVQIYDTLGPDRQRVNPGPRSAAASVSGKRGIMARIKHIALHTEDPSKTAEFYKEVFGLDELRREPRDTGEDGVWLTDGYIYFAILKFGGEQAPNLGEGSSTVKGVHHIGFYVDDLEEACATMERANSTECDGSSRVNRKFKGPDGLMIDLRARGWDEQIRARSTLYQLVEAPPAARPRQETVAD